VFPVPMPHYRDGSPAKVGDVVVGETYNRKGKHLGIVKEVKPGDTCNCTVGLLATVHEDDGARVVLPAAGDDYGETKAFDKVL
jgi:hypothetical protein